MQTPTDTNRHGGRSVGFAVVAVSLEEIDTGHAYAPYTRTKEGRERKEEEEKKVCLLCLLACLLFCCNGSQLTQGVCLLVSVGTVQGHSGISLVAS